MNLTISSLIVERGNIFEVVPEATLRILSNLNVTGALIRSCGNILIDGTFYAKQDAVISCGGSVVASVLDTENSTATTIEMSTAVSLDSLVLRGTMRVESGSSLNIGRLLVLEDSGFSGLGNVTSQTLFIQPGVALDVGSSIIVDGDANAMDGKFDVSLGITFAVRGSLVVSSFSLTGGGTLQAGSLSAEKGVVLLESSNLVISGNVLSLASEILVVESSFRILGMLNLTQNSRLVVRDEAQLIVLGDMTCSGSAVLLSGRSSLVVRGTADLKRSVMDLMEQSKAHAGLLIVQQSSVLRFSGGSTALVSANTVFDSTMAMNVTLSASVSDQAALQVIQPTSLSTRSIMIFGNGSLTVVFVVSRDSALRNVNILNPVSSNPSAVPGSTLQNTVIAHGASQGVGTFGEVSTLVTSDCLSPSTASVQHSVSALTITVNTVADTSSPLCVLDPNYNNGQDTGLSTGAIVGIVVGIVVPFVVVFVLLVLYCRKRELQKKHQDFRQRLYSKSSADVQATSNVNTAAAVELEPMPEAVKKEEPEPDSIDQDTVPDRVEDESEDLVREDIQHVSSEHSDEHNL